MYTEYHYRRHQPDDNPTPLTDAILSGRPPIIANTLTLQRVLYKVRQLESW